MKFEYSKPSVEKCFNDFNLMRKEIGDELAKGVKKRLGELRAAANFSIYLSTGLGKPHPLSGNLKGFYSISISGNFRLIVKPEAPGLDPESLEKCDLIIIRGVVDYHGQKHEWLIR